METDESSGFTEQLRIMYGEKNVGLFSVTPSVPVVVAVLDTGIDTSHPDLTPYVLDGYNFVEENTDVMDRFGHGTMMAGQIIGQETYINLLPVKVISDQGQGNYSDLVEGIYYAVDKGAKVINLSLGSQFSSEAIYDAIQYAKNAGVVVLAAAGNYGTDCPIYPAALPGVLAIGGLGNNGARLGISSYGDNLSLMVAGEEIYSTFLNSTYKSATGTSMATAIAANMAAQLIGQRPELDAFAVTQVLKATATDLGDQLPVSTLTDYKNTLMYLMAEVADNFDSEDTIGEASYGDLKTYEWVLKEFWVTRWVSIGFIKYPWYVKEYHWVKKYYWVPNAGEIIATTTLPILSDYVFDTLYWYNDLIK